MLFLNNGMQWAVPCPTVSLKIMATQLKTWQHSMEVWPKKGFAMLLMLISSGELSPIVPARKRKAMLQTPRDL